MSAKVSSCVDLLAKAFPAAKARDLRRFAVARDGDFTKAKAMFEKEQAWRADNLPVKVADIEEELRKGKFVFRGFDLGGRPIIYIRSKNFDPATRDLDKARLACVWAMERCISRMEGDVEKLTCVWDRRGFSLRKNLDLDLIKAMAKTMQDVYPERLFRAYIYPTNLVFRTVWKIVASFMDPNTRDKVKPVATEGDFLKYVAHDQLLADLGGGDQWEFDAETLIAEALAEEREYEQRDKKAMEKEKEKEKAIEAASPC